MIMTHQFRSALYRRCMAAAGLLLCAGYTWAWELSYDSGDIRIDPAPRWNWTNDAILVPGIDKNGTRQIFVIKVISP